MNRSLLSQAFRLAPLTSISAVAYGLEHAPKLTLNVLNALAMQAATDYAETAEQEQFNSNMVGLMSKCGPWRFGPDAAKFSRDQVELLPSDRPATALLNAYYFDPTMTYTDDNYGEGGHRLFSYAYRLDPCAVFALNFDPRQDSSGPLIESVICVAFLRGTDIWGRAQFFTAMWQEGLPLGDGCAFGIPKWGILRRAHADEAKAAVLAMFEALCRDATESGVAAKLRIEQATAYMSGKDRLPTPVERGFPNLSGTVWHGSEPFPALEDFERELIGADFRQRRTSVPLWFRPSGRELS